MYATVAYAGLNYQVPVTGRDNNLNAMLRECPDDNHAMAFLMQDGNLGVPCGRYGSDTRTCAPVALVFAKLMQYHDGEPITYHGIDHAMGLVVNSHDDVAYLIREYAACIKLKPSDYLEGDDLAECCEGHPAGPDDPMGETVYCDGSCN